MSKEISIGNLYDINKKAVAAEKQISHTNLKKKLRELKLYFKNTKDDFFMFLNKEKSDYTIFYFKEDKTKNYLGYMIDSFKECIENRGILISIDFDKAGGGYEIWIKEHLSENPLVYYLFSCSAAVIK